LISHISRQVTDFFHDSKKGKTYRLRRDQRTKTSPLSHGDFVAYVPTSPTACGGAMQISKKMAFK
jgi:hypothetical protein